MAVKNESAAPTATVPAPGGAPVAPPSTASTLPLEAAPNFAFLAHPGRWDIFESDRGPEILPALTKLEFQPGLAGVRAVKGARDGDPSHAILEKQKKGWVVIPSNLRTRAFGADREGYVHVYDGKAGAGTVHLDVWQRPYVVGSAVFFAKDREGYIAFLRQIRDLLPKIDDNVRAGLREKFSETLRIAKAASSRGSAAAAATVADLERKMEAFKPGAAVARAGAPDA